MSALTALDKKFETKFEELDIKFEKLDVKIDRLDEKLEARFDDLAEAIERNNTSIGAGYIERSGEGLAHPHIGFAHGDRDFERGTFFVARHKVSKRIIAQLLQTKRHAFALDVNADDVLVLRNAGPVGGRAIGRGIGERGGRSAKGSYDTAQRKNWDEPAIGDTKHVETPRK